MINLALLSLTSMGLHAGFGLGLGMIAARQALAPRRAALAAIYTLLIYLPSALAITGFQELPIWVRGTILLTSLAAVGFPFTRWWPSVSTVRLRAWPALVMCAMALWSLASLLQDASLASALLVPTSTLAAVASAQQRTASPIND